MVCGRAPRLAHRPPTSSVAPAAHARDPRGRIRAPRPPLRRHATHVAGLMAPPGAEMPALISTQGAYSTTAPGAAAGRSPPPCVDSGQPRRQPGLVQPGRAQADLAGAGLALTHRDLAATPASSSPPVVAVPPCASHSPSAGRQIAAHLQQPRRVPALAGSHDHSPSVRRSTHTSLLFRFLLSRFTGESRCSLPCTSIRTLLDSIAFTPIAPPRPAARPRRHASACLPADTAICPPSPRWSSLPQRLSHHLDARQVAPVLPCSGDRARFRLVGRLAIQRLQRRVPGRPGR